MRRAYICAEAVVRAVGCRIPVGCIWRIMRGVIPVARLSGKRVQTSYLSWCWNYEETEHWGRMEMLRGFKF